MAKLNIGDQLPEFSLLNQNGETISNKDMAGRATVIFFYPKDNTAICTREASEFRDNFSDFKKLDAQVIGISQDGVASHAQFAKRHQLEYDLLSDTDNSAKAVFGLENSGFGFSDRRVTFVFDKNGKLQHRFASLLHGKKHVREALKSLESN